MTNREAQSDRKISVGDCLLYRDVVTKNEYVFLITKSLIDGFRFEMLVLATSDDLFTQGKQMILTADSTVGTLSAIVKGQI